jgi:hypothetical protein
MDDRQLIADLLSALEYHTEQTRPIQFSRVAIEAAREYLRKPAQQEPVALKWQQAPVKTQWGDGMVVASIAIDKDHTLSLYCERDQTLKVEAMFAQRTWVGLTNEEMKKTWYEMQNIMGWYSFQEIAQAIQSKLKEKNT